MNNEGLGTRSSAYPGRFRYVWLKLQKWLQARWERHLFKLKPKAQNQNCKINNENPHSTLFYTNSLLLVKFYSMFSAFVPAAGARGWAWPWGLCEERPGRSQPDQPCPGPAPLPGKWLPDDGKLWMNSSFCFSYMQLLLFLLNCHHLHPSVVWPSFWFSPHPPGEGSEWKAGRVFGCWQGSTHHTFLNF